MNYFCLLMRKVLGGILALCDNEDIGLHSEELFLCHRVYINIHSTN